MNRFATSFAVISLLSSVPTLVSAADTYRPNLWGYATSGYQIEGAWNADGKGPHIWDYYVQNNASNVHNGDTGNVAANHYELYQDDMNLLAGLGSNTYRFSIQWTRLFPEGSGEINEKGVEFYSNLIDSIIASGNEPIATLFHWDLPLALQNSYGGVADPQFITDFETYSKLLIDTYGDRVKYWLTFNEPASFCKAGYLTGQWPPALTNGYEGQYNCGHNIILAHLKFSDYLHNKYPNSKVGFALNTNWWLPYNDTDGDKEAVELALESTLAWFVDPFFKFYDYPKSLRDSSVGQYLPTFTDAEKESLKTGCDFIGYNYYTSEYAIKDDNEPLGFTTSVQDPNGVDIGPKAGTDWLYVYPSGLRSIANWLFNRYDKDVPIWITENGTSGPGEASQTKDEIKNDTFRQDYFTNHLAQLDLIINEDKIPIQVYLAWSLLDNFEWRSGYFERFGVIGIDYTNGTLERNVKDSTKVIRSFFDARVAVNESSISNANTVNPPGSTGSTGSNGTNGASGVFPTFITVFFSTVFGSLFFI